MPVVLGAIARPTTLSQKCRPRGPLPKNPALRNPGPKKQRLTVRPPLRPAPMSPSRIIVKKRRKSIGKRSKTGKTIFRLLGTILSRVKKATKSAIIVKKRPYCEELPGTSKKLVLVSATSVPVTDGGEKVVRVPCVYYPA